MGTNGINPRDFVDWKFVSDREGGSWLDCYLIVLDGTAQFGRNYTGKHKDGSAEPWNPKWRVRDSMGVTVGTGVDLVAISPAALEAMQVSEETKQTLRPFAGRRGAEVGALLEGGKRVKKEDVEELDRIRSTQIFTRLIELYNASIREGAIPFQRLPAPIQTAIFSFAYQYGPNWGVKQWEPGKGVKAQAFWRHIVAQDWPAAVAELESGYVAEKSRRDLEAAKIREALPSIGPAPTAKDARRHGHRRHATRR
jgi:hypothetical protein